MSYYTAWLKYYHPAAFYAATMSYSVFDKIPMYAADCKAKNIPVLKPDMNTGVPFFAPTVGAKEIRYGLATIKGVANAAMAVYQARKECGPYRDYRDIILKSCIYSISSAALEGLIKSGAADSIMSVGEHRRMYVEGLDVAIKSCRKAIKDLQGDEEMDNKTLYEKVDAVWEMPILAEFVPYSQAEQLQFERQYLGIYVSGSPVEPHVKKLNESGRETTISNISGNPSHITLAGLVHDVSIIHRKSDGAPMAKFVLEDESGVIEAIMFTKNYATYRNEISEGCVAKVSGRIDIEESFNGKEETDKKQLVVSGFCSLL